MKWENVSNLVTKIRKAYTLASYEVSESKRELK